jgi:hypothetical protein
LRILLDACVPQGLRHSILADEVVTAHHMGWSDLDNGALLDAVGDRFDVLITVDRGLPRQQHLAGRPICVVVLRAPSNRLADLLPLVDELHIALTRATAGAVVEVPC